LRWMTGGQYLPGPVRGADALADSPLLGALMVDLREVFDAKVLPLLSPATCAVFGRVGQACLDAVLRSPEIPCAGQTVGVKLGVKDFVGSVKLLAWANDNGCPWDAHTCAVVAKGGHLEVMQWAREHDCPWDERTCESAAENGHLNVLHWAREHGCPWDSNALRAWRQGCPELRELWDESEPMTAWEGVGFGEAGGADAGRVVVIRLGLDGYRPRLTGDVPAELGLLTALKVLDLNGNHLLSVPAALEGLIALKELYLNGNHLRSVPAALGRLTALEVLNLGWNHLDSVPEELGGLTALKSLFLYENWLTSVPAELGALTALKALNLGKNLSGHQLTSVPAEWEEGGALQKGGCYISGLASRVRVT